MGIATSIGYIIQMLVILFAFIFRKGYFHLSLSGLDPSCMSDLSEYGIPTLLQSIAETLREVILNYVNIIIALSYVAVAARGIQSDIAQLLLCIPIGLGETLSTMAGIYYSANDLPENFGGAEADNIYAEIRTLDDVVRESERAYDFCMKHHADKRISTLASLFVEEMAGNVVEHAIRKGNDSVCVNYRLFADRDSICFSIMDLGDRFDPAAFYELYHDSDPERLFGIRMVMNMAKEVLYYNTYRSNNLTIYLETDPDISISS